MVHTIIFASPIWVTQPENEVFLQYVYTQKRRIGQEQPVLL
jgi:hypothetical protein